ncbi:MAG TPA: hypothetical protein VMH83_13400 [Candidatus Acidoferrum sp.]|nr:hypothetical protein [Candidatus Acidoferrum sp.]
MTSKQLILAAALFAACTANVALAQTPACDDKCLTDIAKAYLRDVAKQDSSKLPWADKVRYTENNVAMMIGDGFWGAGPGINDGGLLLTDASTGNVVWYGISTEHEQPAYHGLRLKIVNKQISEVESILGRKEEPEVFAPTDGFKVDPAFTTKLAANAKRSREQLIALVDGYYNTKVQNNGQVLTAFAGDCVQVVNGVNLTAGDAYWAAKAVPGCEAQMKAGVYKPVERIRGRRYPLVNVDTGVVAALSLEDHAVRFLDYTTLDGKPLSVQFGYPNTRGRLDLFKIDDGRIKRIEGVSVFLPYYIRSLWSE